MATRRPDLEALPYHNPGYIAEYLAPPMLRQVKAGTLYYSDVQAAQTAQTDRTLGYAPTATIVSSSSTTWTMAEKIRRNRADASEIEQLGGLAAAQQKMARLGKRAVGSAIESLAVAATFGNTVNISTANILNSLNNAVNVAKEAIGDYADGRIALFGGRRMIDRIKRYAEVTARMVYTGMVPADRAKDVRNISDDILAGALGVDLVLAGPSSEWLCTTTYDGYIGLCVLPDPQVDPDETIQFARTMVMPVPAEGNPANIFQVESYYSDDLKSEVVDCTAWVNLVGLNPEACYILTGCDELNASSTTTTTTGA